MSRKGDNYTILVANKHGIEWQGFSVPVGSFYGWDKDGEKFACTFRRFKGEGLPIYRFNDEKWACNIEKGELIQLIIRKRQKMYAGKVHIPEYAACYEFAGLSGALPRFRRSCPDGSRGKNTRSYMTNPYAIPEYYHDANTYNQYGNLRTPK